MRDKVKANCLGLFPKVFDYSFMMLLFKSINAWINIGLTGCPKLVEDPCEFVSSRSDCLGSTHTSLHPTIKGTQCGMRTTEGLCRHAEGISDSIDHPSSLRTFTLTASDAGARGQPQPRGKMLRIVDLIFCNSGSR